MVKVINSWFVAFVITLVFCNIPKVITLEFIGSNIGDKLSLYVIILGLVYSAYEYIYNKNSCLKTNPKIVRLGQVYFCFLLIVQLLSLLWGVINYPYYGLLESNITILPNRFLTLIGHLNIPADSTFALQLYLYFKGLKNIILSSLWTFGGAFLIYWSFISVKKRLSIEKNISQSFLRNMLIGIVLSFMILVIYGFVELPFLLGMDWAEKVLAYINPYIHQIGDFNNIYLGNNVVGEKAYSWWPPLLWKKQVRSVFPEPSFLGVYCSFMIPWLWYAYINSKQLKKIAFVGMITIMSFFIFLTQSRTAILLLLGESTLLVTHLLFKFNVINFKRIASILLMIGIAWGGSLYFISFEEAQSKSQTMHHKIEAEQYIANNIKSASSTTERSNKARYSLISAEIAVWKEHIWFGTGFGMSASYITEKFDESMLKDQEVRMWVRRINENGPLKAGYPNVSAYTTLLCEEGLIGFIVYMLPFLYLIVHFVSFLYKTREKNNEYFWDVIFFWLLSFIGVLVSGLSTSFTATYCLWFLLGFGMILYEDFLAKVSIPKEMR